MELPPMNKNATEQAAAMMGMGKGLCKNRKNPYTHTGSRNTPATVTSLKATARGRAAESPTMAAKGRGK